MLLVVSLLVSRGLRARINVGQHDIMGWTSSVAEDVVVDPEGDSNLNSECHQVAPVSEVLVLPHCISRVGRAWLVPSAETAVHPIWWGSDWGSGDGQRDPAI